ncbi:hypothetical protein P280DRAFT_131733 [Massarina eburnea CBS 473.64]|uniref:Uncharacterized protein n=1 Tax=Massarina eburnea CBS 473.64 TaxID=1395130 RepID=A0A6A6SGS7_9PLEO|nr:hypothetical protein P280DRAFT_131733 [Massarina eburnea CBS 473.64]
MMNKVTLKCLFCAQDLCSMSKLSIRGHLEMCQTRNQAEFCPQCDVNLFKMDYKVMIAHMDTCLRKPKTAQSRQPSSPPNGQRASRNDATTTPVAEEPSVLHAKASTLQDSPLSLSKNAVPSPPSIPTVASTQPSKMCQTQTSPKVSAISPASHTSYKDVPPVPSTITIIITAPTAPHDYGGFIPYAQRIIITAPHNLRAPPTSNHGRLDARNKEYRWIPRHLKRAHIKDSMARHKQREAFKSAEKVADERKKAKETAEQRKAREEMESSIPEMWKTPEERNERKEETKVKAAERKTYRQGKAERFMSVNMNAFGAMSEAGNSSYSETIVLAPLRQGSVLKETASSQGSSPSYAMVASKSPNPITLSKEECKARRKDIDAKTERHKQQLAAEKKGHLREWWIRNCSGGKNSSQASSTPSQPDAYTSPPCPVMSKATAAGDHIIADSSSEVWTDKDAEMNGSPSSPQDPNTSSMESQEGSNEECSEPFWMRCLWFIFPGAFW